MFIFLLPDLGKPPTSNTSNTGNRTLTLHRRTVTDLTGPGYPYNTGARRRKIGDLPGGLRYASADVKEFQGSFLIEADDPNAGGFAGRLVGGGGRADIHGDK